VIEGTGAFNIAYDRWLQKVKEALQSSWSKESQGARADFSAVKNFPKL
jgi:hypothetical protein